MKAGGTRARAGSAGRRFVPSSFDPADPDFRAIERGGYEVWHSLARLIASAKVRGVMTRLPPFWQAMSPLHAACRERGVPLFLNDIANMPVGGLALKLGVVDAVVAEASDAMRFAEHCADAGVPAPVLWLIVHPASAPEWQPLRSREKKEGLVAHEVHLFPGVPVLEQCEHLAAADEPRFHRVEPQEDEALPFRLAQDGTCPCGKDTHIRV